MPTALVSPLAGLWNLALDVENESELKNYAQKAYTNLEWKSLEELLRMYVEIAEQESEGGSEGRQPWAAMVVLDCGFMAARKEPSGLEAEVRERERVLCPDGDDQCKGGDMIGLPVYRWMDGWMPSMIYVECIVEFSLGNDMLDPGLPGPELVLQLLQHLPISLH